MNEQTYNKVKNAAIENEPIHLTIPVSAIQIEADSIDKKYIIICYGTEQKFTVNQSFFKDLMNILDIKMSMRRNFKNSERNDFFSMLLNALKDASNSISPYDVTLLYDKGEKKITSIKKGNVSKLANKTLFAFIEMILNENPDVSIYKLYQHNGNPEIMLLSDKIHDLTPSLKDVEDESFKFGISIYNNGLNTGIGDFAYRLVCSNGMMGIRTDERLTLSGSNDDNLKLLYENYQSMRNTSFLPQNMYDNINDAYNIHASLYEVEYAFDMISSHVVPVDSLDNEQVKEYIKSKWFPEIDITYQRIKYKNIDPNALGKDEKEHIKTRMSIWELINAVTYIASHHDSVFALIGKNRIQRYAGKLLSSSWDLKFEKFLLI